MRWLLTVALCSLVSTAGCAPPAAQAPASAADPEQELADLDPAEEAPRQPFESVNDLRGPALSINGLRLRGPHGSVRLMVSAYDEGRDIVFQFLPRGEIAPDWLSACPPSGEEPQQPGVQVLLEGAGDLSHNVLHQPGFGWSTSLGIARYAALDTLRFQICGATYELEEKYRERLAQHARMATHRAATAYRQERHELERSCGQGKRDDCWRLAEMMLYGQGGRQEIASARSLFLEQCEQGTAAGCLGAATATLIDERHSQDKVARYREATALALRACELGGRLSGPGCWRAATLQAAGFAVAADAEGAQRSAQTACQRRFQPACTQRQQLLSCARGQAEACVQLADAEAGRSKQHDDGEEALWRLAACTRGHAESCPR
jgi:hypothetical protein